MNKQGQNIEIKGARVNNLKNIHLVIPRNRLVVITGPSGSGKSSLAFDTLYAEGQRRYVESLSAYARQFLGRIRKPDVDLIRGIPPAIAIEQKVNTSNPRSTVGTSTEIYDYLKLLYARIGRTYSPVSGREVKRHTVTDVVDYIIRQDPGEALCLLAPVVLYRKNKAIFFDELKKEGFTRLCLHNQIVRIDEIAPTSIEEEKVEVVVDRFYPSAEPDHITRVSDSVQTAFLMGKGECVVWHAESKRRRHFSNRFEEDGITFVEPHVHLFSFNSPLGACPQCEGYGKVLGIDEDLVIPDKNLSVYDDAVVCWKSEAFAPWKEEVIRHASSYRFPIHKPYRELTDEQKKLLWEGNEKISGINGFFRYLEEHKYKIQYRVMLARYRGKTICPLCKGTRLKPEASYVKIASQPITALVDKPVSELVHFFDSLKLTDHEQKVAGRLLTEIRNRLQYLMDVGLGYLTLNRLSSTLSGGETQRIHLATALGSSLVGSLYILDEPSIGLHPSDTARLIKVLHKLRDIGNTVVVVEHDEEIMKAADVIIDIGPGAGHLGGQIMYNGDHRGLLATDSLTAQYLTGRQCITVPSSRRRWNHYIEIKGARQNNLKNISVKIPLHVFTVVTGVSGSGKSSLVEEILYPALNQLINGAPQKPGQYDELKGDLHLIKAVEMVTQEPVGRSSRSNPVTYSKAYDDIRTLFSRQSHLQHLNFPPAYFSFNTEGGRCEECQGEGEITVEMQFMADVKLVCESCKGKRFKDDVLEVSYRGKNIADILEMTVDEAIGFFSSSGEALGSKIADKLNPLAEVGLGYLRLGQPSSTLSGGESQRLKLASFLGKENKAGATLFIFDEPTTGLHFHDIRKLLDAFYALIKKGHTLLVIEHHPDVIKCADWIIDLGPEGGEKGGYVVFEGTPEEIIHCKKSYTGQYLVHKLS